MSNAAADDSDTWLSSALLHAELAAHQIARFTNPCWDPTWRDLVPLDPPPRLAVGWGTRGRRSRSAKKHSAAEASSCSPATPLDFGSGSGSGSGCGASTSGGDEAGFGFLNGRKMEGGGDVDDVIAGCEMKIGVFDDMQTLCELQEEERLLLENKSQLQKEMETRMKAYEALNAENQRLKGQQVNFHPEKVMVRSATASFELPGSSGRFIVPDLNEPLSESFD